MANTCEECSICMQKIHKKFVMNCGHIFHEECAIRWLKNKNSCPLCRAIIHPCAMNFKNVKQKYSFDYKYNYRNSIVFKKRRYDIESIKNKLLNTSPIAWSKHLCTDNIYRSYPVYKFDEETFIDYYTRQSMLFGNCSNIKTEEIDCTTLKVNEVFANSGLLISSVKYDEIFTWAYEMFLFIGNCYNFLPEDITMTLFCDIFTISVQKKSLKEKDHIIAAAAAIYNTIYFLNRIRINYMTIWVASETKFDLNKIVEHVECQKLFFGDISS